MNNRVNELIAELGITVGDFDGGVDQLVEAVVRECALSVSHIQTARIHTGESVNPSQMIREHFGIKA